MTRILVADDAAVMRKMMCEILLSNHFEIVGEAGNGIEAVSLYKQYKPDIVTMDITMPEMDGLAAIKAIIEFDPQASIIVFSALGHREIIVEAIRAGAKDFIIKPFHRNRVVSAIKDVLIL